MRRFRVLATMALLLTFALVATPRTMAEEEDLPAGTYATAFRVQNLGAGPATCQYTIYSDDGTQAFGPQDLPMIDPGASAYVYTPSVTDFPSGTSSGTIQCDEQVEAVVNFADDDSAASFPGVSSPSSTLYFPSAYNNYYTYFTTMRIQNASTSAQDVTVAYFAPGSATPAKTQTVSLAPNGAATVDQQGLAGLNANVPYSARVTGSAPLAAMISIYGSGPTVQQLYGTAAFAEGATTFYVPVVMSNYYTYNSATTIQNIGDTEAQVELTYSNGKTLNYNIPAKSAQVVLDYEQLAPADTLYSSVIKSTNGVPIIVTVNESTPSTNRSATFEGVSAGGRTLVAPIVLRSYYRFDSSVTCQNVGTTATNVSISYKGTADTGEVTVPSKVVLSNLEPGKTGLIGQFLDDDIPAANFIGSATITSDASDIACVVNQDMISAPENGQSMDKLQSYNALIQQ